MMLKLGNPLLKMVDLGLKALLDLLCFRLLTAFPLDVGEHLMIRLQQTINVKKEKGEGKSGAERSSNGAIILRIVPRELQASCSGSSFVIHFYKRKRSAISGNTRAKLCEFEKQKIKERSSEVRTDGMVFGMKDEWDMFLGSTSTWGAGSRKVDPGEPQELMQWEVLEDIEIEIKS
ncbi:hypothetical protein COCNU_13G007660 [Cocos nucifera]|uniref:Uncharacterized protein n=1 Tax=Cocos nucifera TaxID=13894 RepID=A0A8K0NB49_COCNU|nr:hypothetical protein COCNU_13G007660 [Cocos nucifera]